jgi:hypothetical protein
MKVVKIVVACAACFVMAVSAIGVAVVPNGSVAQAVGPMQSPIPTPKPTAKPPSGGARCTALFTANIRSGPSTRYRIKGRVPRGGLFISLRRSGNWRYGYRGSVTGWVYSPLFRCR